MDYVTRPLSDRTWLRPESERRNSQFSASWSATLELLDRELGYLHAEPDDYDEDVDVVVNGER